MRPLWEKIYGKYEDRCGCRTRGLSSCKGASCTFMKRLSYYHILCGGVLKYWEAIKGKSRQQMKVVRVITSDERRLVGVLINKSRFKQAPPARPSRTPAEWSETNGTPWG
jgi:hypothetical protein